MDSVKKKLNERVKEIKEIQADSIEAQPYQNSGMAFSLLEVKKRSEMLQEFITNIMVIGIDYGCLPNTDKKCLFKSGAEKLCDVFALSKRIEIINRIEDFEKGIFHYEVKAIVVDKKTGVIEAEGVGCCNNMEKKYRSQDAYSVANTILKMAKKRAFVDAVLSATRSSDIFTQDIEDDTGKEKKNAGNEISSSSQKVVQRDHENNLVSKKQLAYMFTLLSDLRIPVEMARGDMQRMYGVSDSKFLNKKQASEFIEYLKNYKKAG